MTEIAATKKLEDFRKGVGERMQNPLKDISFDTIAGAGSHAAIMHYRVTTETDLAIADGTMFLIDSGPGSMSTAPPTSPARSPSAMCRRNRSGSSRWS